MAARTIVGVDGSGPSDAATQWAIERCIRLGSELTLLHAADRDDDEGATGSSASGFRLPEAVSRARAVPGIGTVRAIAAKGDAMAALAAASLDAAIVVVGSHKTGFLRGRVFGSRSLRLASGTHSDVAIIPEPSGRARRGIAVGVDGTAASERAIRFAAQEAAATGQELTLIHAHGSDPGGTAGIEVAGSSDRLLAAARDVALAARPTVTVRLRSVLGPAAVALSDAAPASAMLVLADQRSGVDAPLGRTTHDVLLNLAGPTVIVTAGH